MICNVKDLDLSYHDWWWSLQTCLHYHDWCCSLQTCLHWKIDQAQNLLFKTESVERHNIAYTGYKIHTIPILMYLMRISIIYISSVMLRLKKIANPKCYDCKDLFFFSWQLKFLSIFCTSTEILSYYTVETLGDLQSTSRGLDPVV
jgi:hypothetical protein